MKGESRRFAAAPQSEAEGDGAAPAQTSAEGGQRKRKACRAAHDDRGTGDTEGAGKDCSEGGEAATSQADAEASSGAAASSGAEQAATLLPSKTKRTRRRKMPH